MGENQAVKAVNSSINMNTFKLKGKVFKMEKTKKILKSFVYVLALTGGLIHLFNSATGVIVPFQMRPLHVAVVALIAFMSDSIEAIDKKTNWVRLTLNIAMCVFSVLGAAYLAFNYDTIAKSAGLVTTDIVIYGAMLIAVVMVLAWKHVGPAMVIVSGVFIVYALLGHMIPGMMGHRGYAFDRIVNFIYTNGNGIFGVPIDTSARYLVLFMIMAEYIEQSGCGKFFMAVADLVAKHTRGGAAKSSIVASALFGCISGTPIANVMVTGAFTIPMMKKSGFKPEFAAGVEATASTGGLIMPPIMGAGAFIMAELLGITYGEVMAAAAIPAILYYLSLYFAVDLYSAKQGILVQGDIDSKDIARRMKLYFHTVIPLMFFIISAMLGYSVFRAAIICIIATPFIAAIRKETRMSFKQILDGIADGMRKTVSLGAACACAGIIVGVISMTGFGFSFSMLLGLFKNMPIMALIITMLICIVMGMGMPAVASYLITATIAAPPLIDMGFLPLAVHMFVFYFASFSSVTPPVALASYAAAGLAETDPWKTGWEAFRLAIVAFLCPYMFIYSPGLLGEAAIVDLVILLVTATLGTYSFVAGIQGYMFGVIKNWFWRGVLLIGGALMVIPGWETDVAGLALVIICYALGRIKDAKPIAAN